MRDTGDFKPCFIQCSLPTVHYYKSDHVNVPVNLSLVTKITKSKVNGYYDEQGTGSIEFHFIGDTKPVVWVYPKVTQRMQIDNPKFDKHSWNNTVPPRIIADVVDHSVRDAEYDKILLEFGAKHETS